MCVCVTPLIISLCCVNPIPGTIEAGIHPTTIWLARKRVIYLLSFIMTLNPFHIKKDDNMRILLVQLNPRCHPRWKKETSELILDNSDTLPLLHARGTTHNPWWFACCQNRGVVLKFNKHLSYMSSTRRIILHLKCRVDEVR